MLSTMTPFKQRLLVGSITTVLAMLLILLAPIPAFKPVFTAVIAASIGIATWEFYKIAFIKELHPAQTLGIAFGVLYAIAVAISTQYTSAYMLPDLTLLIAFISCSLYYFVKSYSVFINLSVTLMGLLYLAIPISCMIRIIYFFDESGAQDGRWWLLYMITVSKMTDTGGFFIGKRFGKEPLAPYISPKKTWEGAVGGLLLAILISIAITLLAELVGSSFSLTLWQSVWLGAILSLLAQCGDLVESLLKRDGGIKDSNQLPGLGGMLDMVDSLVFTAPCIYIFLKIYT